MKIGTFGLTRKFVLGRLQIGDPVACYVTKEKKIAALGAVTSPYYLDDTNVFEDQKVYPDRINFKATWLKPEIDFVEILPDMKFIKNPLHWSASFSSGIAEITSNDWELINRTVQSTVS